MAGMHLARVIIKNFRCIREATVELQPGLNVIVGRNNIGKTALFAAIRIAIGPAASPRGDVQWISEDDFWRPPNGARADSLSIELVFENLSETQRAFFFEIVEFDLTNLSASKATIRFEATWPKGKKHASVKRCGGPKAAEHPPIPSEILESLPITFLPALRDAEAGLTPGNRSRLAMLFKDLARRDRSNEDEIVNIFRTANQELESKTLITNVRNAIRTSTEAMAGTDYCSCSITAADVEFERILKTLRVQMDGAALTEIGSNGLGYNNLLFVATVLAHLSRSDETECPLLLVEEPEAHLHPQLTILLGRYLAESVAGSPQTIVTTHSPTLAASTSPSRIITMFTDGAGNTRANSLSRLKFTEDEEIAIRRLLDVTRATMYFARAVILVEGISEALVIPVLAQRMGVDLAKVHISVVPIGGVEFPTFRKLLSSEGLAIRCAVLTDADPEVERPTANWRDNRPKGAAGGGFDVCARTKHLVETFRECPHVMVRNSSVTLEYDLALAGANNPAAIVQAWESCFIGTPGLNAALLASGGDSIEEKALTVWRGICCAFHTGSKADLAHRLAASLEKKNGRTALGAANAAANAGVQAASVEDWAVEFAVPGYIQDAIKHVAPPTTPPRAVATNTAVEALAR